jgi:hypothetical protein
VNRDTSDGVLVYVNDIVLSFSCDTSLLLYFLRILIGLIY